MKLQFCPYESRGPRIPFQSSGGVTFHGPADLKDSKIYKITHRSSEKVAEGHFCSSPLTLRAHSSVNNIFLKAKAPDTLHHIIEWDTHNLIPMLVTLIVIYNTINSKKSVDFLSSCLSPLSTFGTDQHLHWFHSPSDSVHMAWASGFQHP